MNSQHTDSDEGQHPVQRQASADLAMPWWWLEAAAALLILVLGLSAAFSNGITS